MGTHTHDWSLHIQHESGPGTQPVTWERCLWRTLIFRLQPKPGMEHLVELLGKLWLSMGFSDTQIWNMPQCMHMGLSENRFPPNATVPKDSFAMKFDQVWGVSSMFEVSTKKYSYMCIHILHSIQLHYMPYHTKSYHTKSYHNIYVHIYIYILYIENITCLVFHYAILGGSSW